MPGRKQSDFGGSVAKSAARPGERPAHPARRARQDVPVAGFSHSVLQGFPSGTRFALSRRNDRHHPAFPIPHCRRGFASLRTNRAGCHAVRWPAGWLRHRFGCGGRASVRHRHLCRLGSAADPIRRHRLGDGDHGPARRRPRFRPDRPILVNRGAVCHGESWPGNGRCRRPGEGIGCAGSADRQRRPIPRHRDHAHRRRDEPAHTVAGARRRDHPTPDDRNGDCHACQRRCRSARGAQRRTNDAASSGRPRGDTAPADARHGGGVSAGQRGSLCRCPAQRGTAGAGRGGCAAARQLDDGRPNHAGDQTDGAGRSAAGAGRPRGNTAPADARHGGGVSAGQRGSICRSPAQRGTAGAGRGGCAAARQPGDGRPNHAGDRTDGAGRSAAGAGRPRGNTAPADARHGGGVSARQCDSICRSPRATRNSRCRSRRLRRRPPTRRRTPQPRRRSDKRSRTQRRRRRPPSRQHCPYHSQPSLPGRGPR